jgi:hypothetical protein
MSKVYTCPYCKRKYTVNRPGNYICDCGIQFSYPDQLTENSANYTTAAPTYIDSSSRSVQKHTKFNALSRKKMRYISKGECPFAKASLICGIMGLLFFGLLSLPAVVLGLYAKNMSLNPRTKYRGSGMAIIGILLGIAGAATWSWILFFVI